MDNSIIVSLILSATGIICSTICSVCFGIIPRRRKTQIENSQQKVKTLFMDIRSLWMIENTLLESLKAATGQKKETLKKTVRKKIAEETGHILSNNAKPSVFKKEINNTF